MVIVLLLRATTTNETSPLAVQQLLDSLASYRGATPPVTFGISRDKTISLYCKASHKGLTEHLRRLLWAHYPDCQISQPSGANADNQQGYREHRLDLMLCPDLFALKQHVEHEDQLGRRLEDPLRTVIGALEADHEGSLPTSVEWIVKPARRQRLRARNELRLLLESFWGTSESLMSFYLRLRQSRWWWIAPFLRFWTTTNPRLRSVLLPEEINAVEQKLSQSLFWCRLRLKVSVSPERKSEAREVFQRLHSALGVFCGSRSRWRGGDHFW